MKIKETFIVWSEKHNQLVKLHMTSNNDGIKWFIEVHFNIYAISFDEATELTKQ
jgi:hypothetical protein